MLSHIAFVGGCFSAGRFPPEPPFLQFAFVSGVALIVQSAGSIYGLLFPSTALT